VLLDEFGGLEQDVVKLRVMWRELAEARSDLETAKLRMAELAEDLESWLAGKPIRARRSSAFEQFKKWARRHPRFAALMTSSAILSLNLMPLRRLRPKRPNWMGAGV
jgi:hypothetical protein